MAQDILFLGTQGSDSVFYSQGNAAGMMLNINNTQILIDPGPGTLLKAYQYNISLINTKLILVSHNHLSHCNDLNIAIEAMTRAGMEKRGAVIGDEATIFGTDMEKPYLTNAHRKQVEKFLALSPGEDFRFDNLLIRATKTSHSAKTAIGFKIFTGRFTLTYTSDTKFIPELLKEYEGTDVLIANNVHPFGSKSEDNLSTDDTLKIIQKINPSLTILTHFGRKLSQDVPIYEARNLKKQIDSRLSVISAKEGIAFDPIAYSTILKQKTLIGFQNPNSSQQSTFS